MAGGMSAFGGPGMMGGAMGGGGRGLSAFGGPPGAGMGGGQLTPQQILMLLQMQGGGAQMGAAQTGLGQGVPGGTPMGASGPQMPMPAAPGSNAPPPMQGQAIQPGAPPNGQAAGQGIGNILQMLAMLKGGQGGGMMSPAAMQAANGLGSGWDSGALQGLYSRFAGGQ